MLDSCSLYKQHHSFLSLVNLYHPSNGTLRVLRSVHISPKLLCSMKRPGVDQLTKLSTSNIISKSLQGCWADVQLQFNMQLVTVSMFKVYIATEVNPTVPYSASVRLIHHRMSHTTIKHAYHMNTSVKTCRDLYTSNISYVFE